MDCEVPAIKLPPRSLGIREFSNGLRIKTSSRLLIQDTGGDIWKGSIGLLAYLKAEIGDAGLKRMKILEISSGTGALGLCLSLLGARIMMTDLPSMTALIEENTELNKTLLKNCRFEVHPLDWRDSSLPDAVQEYGPYDIVIASDGATRRHDLISPLFVGSHVERGVFGSALRRRPGRAARLHALHGLRAAPGARANPGGACRGVVPE